ncbi:Early-responsive to dehydration 4 [Heracleum sosnowskyi]|uniref:Early-responsive to dehydration 4 n=1 Tax=Heracleum sosnowskyi TaxID=360622 RepID=A0AAD8I4I5_9APIA|nr:Early-responsive to dehydration 4 [Heracleum sosnowskyi]
MDFNSFLTSLGTSFAIFVVLMLLFTWLSRKQGNAVVYYPNRILKGMDPWEERRSGERNPVAWIQEAISSSEQDVVTMSGVDTAVYFVFLGTAVGILVLASLVLLPLLLPVAASDPGESGTNSNGAFNELDRLAMGHVQQRSQRLWAFVFATYWVSIVTYYLLWNAYKHVSDLRAAALVAPVVRPQQFAVVVRDIPTPPEGQSRKEQVDTFFREIYPDTFYKSLVVTNNKQVDKIWQEIEGYRKKLSHAEAVYVKSKTGSNPAGTRPTCRTGFLGLLGDKVDTIDYYHEKINELIPKLKAEQKVTLREKQQSSALIFFSSRLTAASAAQNLHSRMVDTWSVVDAPEPCQIIWSNLPKNFYERHIRQYVVYFIVFLTIVFYMIPIGFVSAFTTLSNLMKLLPFIKPIVKEKVLRTVLEAYLPQLALIIFLALLPKFLFFLSVTEGIFSESHAIRAASGKYFYFSVLNVFIGVTVGGTLFSTFKTIEKDPNIIVPLLANSLPGNATFFLTYVALKFFVGYGLELSRMVPLIIYHLKRKYVCKTEAELKEAWAPGDLGYGTRIPADMLILTIVLCYSVIAPVIIPFGVVYFGLGWLVLRNQALKVLVPSYESYGNFWPHIYTRIMAALILFQLTMFGYFGVKQFYYTAILVPLPILSLIFAYICKQRFYQFFHDTALEVVRHEVKEIPNMEHVYRSFLPPSLATEKPDDDQFDDAASQGSKSGSAV